MKWITLLLLAASLAGCVNVTIVTAPAPTAPPPTCPVLELEDVARTGDGETAYLRATNPGPGPITLDKADFAMVDTSGQEHRTVSETRELRPGQDVPVELTARHAKGWIETVRLDQPGCPTTIALPAPR